MENAKSANCLRKFSSLLLMKVLKMLISLRSKNNIWEICHVMEIISSHVELIQYEKCFLLFVGELWLVQPRTTDLLVHGTNLHHHSNIFPLLRRPLYITPQTNFKVPTRYWNGFESIYFWNQWIWPKFTLHIENIWKLKM